MSENYIKIIAMLRLEIQKALESQDLKLVEAAWRELAETSKLELSKLEDHRKALYIQALNGQETGEVNGFLVEYKENLRSALDQSRVKEYFLKELGMTEQEMRDLVYSITITKPSLKLKTLKN
jgi:hypothetical protein